MTPTYEQKLAMFAENKDFAIFNELSSLNDLAKDIIKAVESSKTEVVHVDNLSDAIVDLSPLQANFEALKGSVGAVTKAIQAIPKTKELDMSGIEKLLGQIANKEMDMSHMETMTKILDDILFAVQTTASHSDDKDEVLAPDLKKIQDILNLLNENVVAIEIPGFDYEKLARIIKDNIKISGGGGGHSAVNVKNVAGDVVNPATSEKQDAIITNTTGLASESTLQAVLAAQGGSVYNYIQSEETATYKYYGYASTTGWKMKRKTLSTGVWMVDEGTGDYATAWADRANKAYAYT